MKLPSDEFLIHEIGNLLKNNEIRVKTAYQSEPYALYGERGTQSLNTKFVFYRDSI